MVDFFIVCGNGESGLPSLCKAIQDRIFFDIESAQSFKASLEVEFGVDVRFAIYRCNGEVISKE